MTKKVDPEIDPSRFHDQENTVRIFPESKNRAGKHSRKIDPEIDPNQFIDNEGTSPKTFKN